LSQAEEKLDSLLDERLLLSQQLKNVNADIEAHEARLAAAELEATDTSIALALVEEALREQADSGVTALRPEAEQRDQREAKDRKKHKSEEEWKPAGPGKRTKRVKEHRGDVKKSK
jgi:ribosomal protein L12E/L44/L45/RPP1/RPP2